MISQNVPPHELNRLLAYGEVSTAILVAGKLRRYKYRGAIFFEILGYLKAPDLASRKKAEELARTISRDDLYLDGGLDPIPYWESVIEASHWVLQREWEKIAYDQSFNPGKRVQNLAKIGTILCMGGIGGSDSNESIIEIRNQKDFSKSELLSFEALIHLQRPTPLALKNAFALLLDAKAFRTTCPVTTVTCHKLFSKIHKKLKVDLLLYNRSYRGDIVNFSVGLVVGAGLVGKEITGYRAGQMNSLKPITPTAPPPISLMKNEKLINVSEIVKHGKGREARDLPMQIIFAA